MKEESFSCCTQYLKLLSVLQVLFTKGELAGRSFHYHFVVDRGMTYDVRSLALLLSQ